jgi:uncharacterized protein YndB with AHSA1/START domain
MNDMHVVNETEALRTVVVEREFPYPAEKLWRALTQPHLIAEWLMKNDFLPTVGHRFTLSMTPQPGMEVVVHGEVLNLEPNRSLSYTWDHPSPQAAFDLKSVVTFTLTPTAGGTRLRMEQSGFRPDQNQAYAGANYGWQNFLGKLEQVLAGGA